MALKTIKYTIGTNGINPAFECSAGTQCDHKVYDVQFRLEQDLYDGILKQIGGGKAVYRYDCFDGEGNVHSSKIYDLKGMTLEPYVLEYGVTKMGGKIKICLVVSVVNSDNTTFEYLNCAARLYLKNLPDVEFDNDEHKSLSSLAYTVNQNAQIAENAKNAVLQAQNEMNDLKLALETGEWVFDANEPESELDVDFVVDDDFDNSSKNALSNNKITERFAELENSIKLIQENLSWQSFDELVNAIKGQIFLEAHPVGSYYWSSNPISPAEIFGGNWKRIENRFIFAAGDGYTEGSVGGEVSHLLTVSEMPSHSHKFNPDTTFNGINFVVPTLTDGIGGSSISEQGSAHRPGHWANETWGTYSVGGNEAHNNMPPYIVAYCWQRIEEGEK